MNPSWLCATLAFAAIGSADAQSWEVFNSANAGLPSNTVTDVAIEENGVVWAATDWGLWRYEVGEWQVFQTANSGLPENVLRSVAIDAQGRVWVGTNVNGAAVFDGQAWEVFNTTNSPLPDDQVNTIHVDQNGWVWLGTVAGLACYTGSEWRIYDSTPSSYNGRVLNGDHILSMDSRDDGLYIIGTLNGGFHFLTDTSVHFFTTFNSGFWDNTQKAVLFDEVSSERWVACPAGGLLRQFGDWYGGTWFQYATFNSDLPSNALVDLALASDGQLWLATQTAGIARRASNGAYVTFTTANSGMPVNEVNCLALSADGAIWVGLFDGGLARFDPSLGMERQTMRGKALTIAPTVNDGSFSVLGLSAAQFEWSVSDMSGRIQAHGVASSIAGTVKIGRLELPAGSYLLHMASDGMSSIGRFMVH